MFYIIAILGVVSIVAGIVIYKDFSKVLFGVAMGIFGIILIIGAFFTPQGRLVTTRLFVSGVSQNWLIVDESGGVTKRHWILKDSYVKSSTQSDGWQFTDKIGNLCYVSGDSYLMTIKEPLEEFETNYKEKYNIPADQQALE